MKDLHVSAIPILNMLQKACEVLVVSNTTTLDHTYNVDDRRALIKENDHATEMIDHIRNLLINIHGDCLNPKL